ncbi:MBL fold metallo-hydrolase [Flavobacterium sp. D11R37]|uniref:MBL fold metallo-hydrolase n=1 Tax=Flavobacterium coralii TaxID=2838017 RepID=UPI001CA701CD|nr:MBL fold metallo-hydrolase [Flavobacterium coralii]MBY8963433.1 MBL fold metallo-hydrolase [Flavobacterium coralii]
MDKDKEMHQSKDSHIIPVTSIASGKGREAAPDVYYYTDQIVNVIFVGLPGSASWVLIDAGMPGSGKNIIKAAEERFGKGSHPEAIILTHGHFDHVGAIVHLLETWGDISVYAHPEEFPFLTGKKAYPKPDPFVEGGGLIAKSSFIYPHEPIDITPVLLPLPHGGTVPRLLGWRWLHTPGHSPGHISLFRESDRCLIAGDAFVTVKQSSLYKVIVQKEEVQGPPRYLTTDWVAAGESVRMLNSLKPACAVTGHGMHMEGKALAEGLERLAADFDTIAKPEYGKYVDDSE